MEQVHRARDHLDHLIGDFLLKDQQAQRRTTLARRPERGCQHVGHNLFGKRSRIDDHRVDAPGLRNQRDQRAVLVDQQRRGDALGGRGRSGKGDAGDAQVAGQFRADFAAAGDEDISVLRHARLMRQFDRAARDQRRLRRRLGDHGVAGDEGRDILAGKDRQREIPRRDGGPGAAPFHTKLVPLAGRPRQHARRTNAARPHRIIAAEIGSFANFTQRVRNRFERFLDANRHQFDAMFL